MRIWENPNHPHYGPVRRLWVMLAQLDMLGAAERAYPLKSQPWDRALCMNINFGHSEATAQQYCLRHIFKHGGIK